MWDRKARPFLSEPKVGVTRVASPGRSHRQIFEHFDQPLGCPYGSEPLGDRGLAQGLIEEGQGAPVGRVCARRLA